MLTLIPWASLRLAGDAAPLQPLGSCANGQDDAFAQIGVLDGSGVPCAEVTVAEVAKTTLVGTAKVAPAESLIQIGPSAPEPELTQMTCLRVAAPPAGPRACETTGAT